MKMKTKNGTILLKNGKPQALDRSIGGYPFDAINVTSVHIGERPYMERWAKALGGEKEGYRAVEATFTLVWEEE